MRCPLASLRSMWGIPAVEFHSNDPLSLTMVEKESAAAKNLPRALRESIQKTVKFILKNGPDFQTKLVANDKDGLFSFLDPNNEHHEYYKQVLERSRVEEQKTTATLKESEEAQPLPIRKPIDLSFIQGLPIINNRDLQILKLTAQALAANDDEYANGFKKHTEKTGRKLQFAFLEPNHSYYSLFKHYLDWYRGIIDYSEGAGSILEEKILDSLNLTEDELLNRSFDRAVYEKSNKITKQNQEAELKLKQEHYASIDWQDFLFAARINFDAIDEVTELAAPLVLEDVMSRSLAVRAKTLEIPSGGQTKQTIIVQEATDSVNSMDSGVPENNLAPQTHISQPPLKGMKVRAAGESRLKRKEQSVQEKTLVCPFTGQNIPEVMFDSHLRNILRDPRYKEQQENYMLKNFKYASNLSTEQVYENIKSLVRGQSRSEEEEAVLAKKLKLY